ncbi:MAG: hypothetical protein WC582_02580 [Patescibacteria group bacterium]
MWQSVSNNLKIFIDYTLFNNKFLKEEINIGLMEDYLERCLPKICSVQFVYPKKMAESIGIRKRFAFKKIIFIEDEIKSGNIEELLELMKNDFQKNSQEIEEKLDSMNNELLDIAIKEKCHLFVTDRSTFIENKSDFKDKNILIVDLPDLLNFIESFLSGFFNFFKFNSPVFGLTNPDMAHMMTSPLFQKVLFKTSDLLVAKNNRILNEFSRTLFFNRYPDLLISIDKIKFYYLQRNIYIAEYGKTSLPEFDGYLRYYIYVYYSLLWTICDINAWIINYALELGFDESNRKDRNNIGLSKNKKDFFERLKGKSSELADYLLNEKFQEWIGLVADVRHQNSHRNSSIASALFYTDGKVDKMTDEEIDKILYPEGKVIDNQELFSQEFIENQKRLDRTKYKISKMEKVMDTFIVLDGGKRLFDPIARIKTDLGMLETLSTKINELLDKDRGKNIQN